MLDINPERNSFLSRSIRDRVLLAAFAIFVCMSAVMNTQAQTTEFIYQGQLQNASVPANGNFDFEFLLFGALSGGTQAGSTLTKTSVVVSNGTFSVNLDFGANFPGATRFLEIHVRQTGGGAFTPLTPRQAVSSSPYSVKSLTADTATNATSATTATNATQLGGVAANQYVVTTDPRMTDERNPLPGSSNYIQNQNAKTQAASNFNISGTGTANIFSATTQYNIGADRVLSVAGTNNVFAGVGAGQANTTGFSNAFFGTRAGLSNTTGGDNAFFGRDAGQANSTGVSNAFFGTQAGQSNTTGDFNAFFGTNAGFSNTMGAANAFFGTGAGLLNTTGGANAFFGTEAGRANTTGANNAFFGRSAGQSNTTGISNAFFGAFAGQANTTGFDNAFFGESAGFSNTTGTKNTSIGDFANVGSGALTFATAIGANAVVIASNQVQLGREALDTVRIGTFNAGGPTQVCVNNFVLTFCASSRRYKENVQTLRSGLNVIERLRPVTFDWKDRKEADLGLIAEEVDEVEPLLVIRNDKGVIESVKYSQLTVVLVNAVKEQQTQIEEQKRVIVRQNAKIDALMRLVCASNKDADICKEN